MRRDLFVANVLWVGVCLLCEGTLSPDLDFRGTPRCGEASCENGLGDDLLVLWDEHGVIARVHDDDERHAPLDSPASFCPGGAHRARPLGLLAGDRWLWLCGDSSSPRLPPSASTLLGLLDHFCGPPLFINHQDYSPERELFEAIVEGQGEVTEAVADRRLDSPLLTRRGRTRLEAARALANDLLRFDLLWSNVERDVAKRG